MATHDTCELVQFRITAARFIHIEPRPRDAPPDMEERFLELVRDALESESHTCGDGCDCVIGDPVQVATREQIKKVTDGTYTAWYEVTLAKYRSAGECMPAADEAPERMR